MSKILLDLTMSLDGFMAGPNVSDEHPMGESGLRLHDWLFKASDSPIDAEISQEMHATTGAVVLGRRTFDVGRPVWQDTPYPAPSFVVTHRLEAPRTEKSGTFTFVSDVDTAAKLALVAAGEKDVRLMGAQTAQAFLDAALVDEVRVQIVPILLGAGVSLFANLKHQNVELDQYRVVASPRAIHAHYRVIK